jgi:probable F420-dependent oxidoreductase
MDIGLVQVFGLAPTYGFDYLGRFARTAEHLAFESIWLPEHVAFFSSYESVYPYPPEPGSQESSPVPGGDRPAIFDPLLAGQAVALHTSTVRVGTAVALVALRHPLLWARQLATLDHASNGRFELGVGVGWMREEFEVLGMPWDHRGARADEQLELFQAMFSRDMPSYEGRYYQVPEVGFSPRPAAGRLPVWVGGDTEPAFRRTVRFGDAFHAAFQKRSEVADAWQRIGELCDEAGRDRGELRLSIRLYLDPAQSMAPAKSIGGSDEQMLETIGQWQAIGVDHILLDPVAPGGLAGRRNAMEAFMTNVAPRVG